MKKAKPSAPASPTRPASPAIQAQQAAFARSVLKAEAQAVAGIRIDKSFHQAVDLILHATGAMASGRGAPAGAVVVTGLGKSGLVGRKISATLASTGTTSHFMHPVEAMHGDLGQVRRGDVVLALSFGGNTDEVTTLAAILKQDGVPVIAILGHSDCDLGRLATVNLCLGRFAEACPMNLAPTASTTAMLALGDALALSVSRRRHFGVADFRKVHPGGGLGRQLLPISQVLRLRVGHNLPLVPTGITVAQALAKAEGFAAAGRRVGAVLVVHDDQRLAGIFTDGDLRRLVLRLGPKALEQTIDSVMAHHPRHLSDTALVRDAVKIAREFRFDEIPVVDQHGRAVGLIDVQDLVALKVIEG
jgi:arabinose-5-phosphate isomerase